VLDFKDAPQITYTRDPRCAQPETDCMVLAALAVAMLFLMNLSAYLVAVAVSAPASWFGAGSVLSVFAAIGVYATVRASFADQADKFQRLFDEAEDLGGDVWENAIAAASTITIVFTLSAIACFVMGLIY
jgi:hypothetical protein